MILAAAFPRRRAPSMQELPAELADEVYDELRSVARRTLGRWTPGQSLEATALVHEAWLRMAQQECFADLGRETFLSVAALSIRRILVDRYRARNTRRRSAGGLVPLMESMVLETGPSIDLLALDEALEALAAIEPRQAQIVDLRFFGGLTENEVAEALGVSLRTVSSDWRYARAWLASRVDKEAP